MFKLHFLFAFMRCCQEYSMNTKIQKPKMCKSGMPLFAPCSTQFLVSHFTFISPAIFNIETVNLCRKFVLWENSFVMFIFTNKHICNIVLLLIIIIIILWNGGLYRLLVCYIPCHICHVLFVERQITVPCGQVWHVSEVVDWFQFYSISIASDLSLHLW